ncbi:EamA family transporter [Algicella marina]|uniref:EamA family transporter n=2 Tax=Algicella marina TaxID=2683284 RepID=A0A6P1T611_9RHOB|nr:EamA family transporter [Algicella marina]
MWRAIGLMALSMSLIPAGDGVGKLMMEDYGVAPFFIAWSRFSIGVILVLPFLNQRNFAPRALMDWRVLLRGALIGGTVALILTGARTEGLATVFGAFFIGPILSYFLSALFLKEPIRPAQTALLFIGFVGVLLVIKPGFGMTPGIAFAALAGVGYGMYLVTGRWLANAAPAMTLLFAQVGVAAIVLIPFGISDIPPMRGYLPMLLLISAFTSTLANFLLLFAYREVQATRLAPFVYLQLVAATLYGFLLFGDIPDLLTIAGLLLLVSSGFSSLALKRGP